MVLHAATTMERQMYNLHGCINGSQLAKIYRDEAVGLKSCKYT